MTFKGRNSLLCYYPKHCFVKPPKLQINSGFEQLPNTSPFHAISPNHRLLFQTPSFFFLFLFALDCFQVVGQSFCPEQVCTRDHVLARSGGPSDQSQASGRARIRLSLQLLMPSDLNAGRADLMLFSRTNMEGLLLCRGFANLSQITSRESRTCYVLEYILAFL